MEKIKIFLWLGVSFLFLSCASQSPITPSKKERSIQGPLLAQVNDWRIGLEDFEKRLEVVKALLKDEKIKIDYDFKVRLLDEMITNAILAQEAIKRGMERDEEVIKAVEEYKQTILAERLKEELTKDLYVTDTEVESFYNQNREQLRGLAEFKVREIAVNSLSKANELAARLLQGEDFSRLAEENSLLESAKKGGDLGFITYEPNKKFDKFWATLATLDEGVVSAPFKGPDGKYYIIKLEAKRGGEIISLSKIRDNLKKVLEEKKRLDKINKIIQETKQKSKVIINTDLLK